jgi:hypothetical protein
MLCKCKTILIITRTVLSMWIFRNFPFWQVYRAIAPSMMVGNVYIMRHAQNVPMCALAIEETFRLAGFPDGALQKTFCSIPSLHEMLEDPRVKATSLTGRYEIQRNPHHMHNVCLCVQMLIHLHALIHLRSHPPPFSVLAQVHLLPRRQEVSSRRLCLNSVDQILSSS